MKHLSPMVAAAAPRLEDRGTCGQPLAAPNKWPPVAQELIGDRSPEVAITRCAWQEDDLRGLVRSITRTPGPITPAFPRTSCAP
jgi:hypothetical protein